MFLFVTQIFWVFIQTRRQDFAAARTKNHKRENIFKIQYWMYAATGGPNMKWGHIWGKGATSPRWWWPCFYCTNTGLFWCVIWVYLKSLNGSPACDCWTHTSWQVMQRDSLCRINNSSKCSNCYGPRAFGGPAVFCNKSYLSHYISDFFQS